MAFTMFTETLCEYFERCADKLKIGVRCVSVQLAYLESLRFFILFIYCDRVDL